MSQHPRGMRTPGPGTSRGGPASRLPRIALVGLMGVLGAAALGVFLVWLVFFSSTAPAAPTIESAAAQVSPGPGSDGTVASASADGTWVVDTPEGDPLEGIGSFVGFRVAEVLVNIGQTEAIGRTAEVSGSLAISGTLLEQATIEVGLTRIRSDQSRRESAIQRALETAQHPTASFVSSGPVDLGAIPSADQTVTVSVPGVLTIHGVSQEVEAQMEARLAGDSVVVVGSLQVDFTAFGVTMPRAPIVVSVEDSGQLEWQLFFRRAA